MNATFNIRRQGLTIYRELLQKYPVLLASIGILLLGYIFIWGLCLLSEDTIGSSGRTAVVYSLISFTCCLIPFILYKNENRRMAGVFYAVSPSSTLEKTISMLIIVSVIFPLLSTVLLLSLDSLLTVIPLENGFRGSLWGSMFSPQQYMDSTMKLFGGLNVPADSMNIIDQSYDFMRKYAVPPIVGIAVNQSFFVFLNMLFRRHKIGYTLLTFLCLGIVFSILSVILSIVLFAHIESMSEIDVESMLNWLTTGYRLAVLIIVNVLPVVFWVLTYFRIRRLQY